MFGIGDSIEFTFDGQRRLRVSVPADYLPLAAWLTTDAQPHLSGLDHLVGLIRHCQREGRTLVGNGCSVDLVNDVVLLESSYGRWPRAVIPESLFWPVLEGLHGFMAGAAREPTLARPADYPEVFRATTEHQDSGAARPVVVDHTYFPLDWTNEDVMAAGEGAWQSPETIRDPHTGTWSGVWRNLELAGYYDPGTGEALTYFPVIAP
ncbi:EndoU domain-containing protein [Saccharothrix sp. NRRL B-16348]|uniref:EndoU domain-containing protein n=1 Tax=Saccharothrix sp. NRRL B-16348 TaxID=1415542 RepID=UPI000ABC5CF2|nr:EndoU domain-containing protein [Saccharothrix sp. NRRL B-16348]